MLNDPEWAKNVKFSSFGERKRNEDELERLIIPFKIFFWKDLYSCFFL